MLLQCPIWDADADERDLPKVKAAASQALREASSQVEHTLPDPETLRSWHRQVFAAVVPLYYYAGEFRQVDTARNCLNTPVYVDGIPGSPSDQVLADVDRLFDFAREQLKLLEVKWSTLDRSERARRIAMIVGVTIGRLIQIHPFVNGNGRTSRLLWCVLLARFKLPPQVTILRRPMHPYGQLMGYAMRGDFGPIVAAVAHSLAKAPAPAR